MLASVRLFLVLLFAFEVVGDGIPVPLIVSGTFEAKDVSGLWSYTGSFTKESGTDGKWVIEASSMVVETAPFQNSTLTFHYKEEKEDYIVDVANKALSGCVPTYNIPPLHELKGSFESARKVPNTVPLLSNIVCNGELWEFNFTGLLYLLCIENGKFQTVYGTDFVATINEMDLPLKYFPTSNSNCATTTYNTLEKNFTSSSLGHRWYQKKPQNTQQQKDCFFLHGSGVVPEDNMVGGFPSKNYWGDLKKFAPHCKNHYPNAANTLDRGWDDANLQKEVCAFLTQDQQDKSVVKNKVIYAHSMGNLILAAAIKNGVCFLDASSSWYELQGPMLGSKAAGYVKDGCADSTSAVRILSSVTGDFCDSNGVAYPVYVTMVPNYYDFRQLASIMSKYVKGAICGESSWGLNTIYSPALSLIDLISGLESPNDGMVTYSSCAVAGSFSAIPEANFYRAQVNHADGTCRNGNGWFGADRQPCSWFTGKM